MENWILYVLLFSFQGTRIGRERNLVGANLPITQALASTRIRTLDTKLGRTKLPANTRIRKSRVSPIARTQSGTSRTTSTLRVNSIIATSVEYFRLFKRYERKCLL